MTVDLPGYASQTFAAEGMEHLVYRAGAGPAVIVMEELPGITPRVLEFAGRVVDLGCTVWIPQFFGTPGRRPELGAFAPVTPAVCINREFTAFATGRTPPVTRWLRALAAHAHDECGGPGVGAVGMCFTGGFALGMMVDERMLAPVLSQPSLPIVLDAKRRRGLPISEEDLETVRARTEDGACVLGLRFTGDRLCPPERFESLREALGDAFIGVEIDSSSGNPWGIRSLAHSVLTEDLDSSDPEHPTAVALAQVLDFFRTRLQLP